MTAPRSKSATTRPKAADRSGRRSAATARQRQSAPRVNQRRDTMLHRTIALTSVAAALICTAALRAETSALVEHLTFTAANAPQDGLSKDRRLSLTLRRWSTDQ